MSGFPTVPSRASFGPTPVDVAPVRDPDRYLAADLGDLMMWQISGSGVAVSKAWALLDFTGPSTLTFSAGHECWDPDDDQADPTPTRNGTGDYELAYSATYPDKDGTAITTSLIAAKPYPQTTSDYRATAKIDVDNRTVLIKIYDSAGSPVDCDVLVEVR
jgi:hypothetical protein